jgi:Fe-S-cluster-containing dehydrogenase component
MQLSSGRDGMKILVDAEKCTGCNSCEMICYFRRVQIFNPEKSRIKVVHLDYLGFSNPVACIQCKNPKCVEVCPTDALSQREDGTIRVDEEKCNACRFCVGGCIIGAVNFDNETNLPLICDHCGGSPACVEWCPTGALTIKDTQKDIKGKEMEYTIKKAKPFLKKCGIASNELDWYKKFI